jgi:DNA anti-recombination protein RmuC
MEIALIVLAAAVVLAAVILAFVRPKAAVPELAAPDPRLDDVIRGQGAIAEQFRQTSVQVEALKQRLGESLAESATKTAETLGGIGARLNVIDEAHKNISALSGQVVSLQQVLSNKQSRGAYGQAQMEEIVRDGLPPSLYDFQFTLTNRNRPDCIIRIPGNKALLVIDSKFPLESFDLLRNAANDEEKKIALAQVRATPAKSRPRPSCSCLRNRFMPTCMTVLPM